MKKKSKALLVLLSAVALVVTTMLGTMAYLTDTESVKNTFTVGKVGITLDEKNVDNDMVDGKIPARDQANDYHLIPGQTYDKDPTIHVDENSEDCWLFVKVENDISTIEDATTIADQMEANGWTLVDGETNVYAYEDIVEGGNDVKVFETFKIKGDVDIATYDGAKIIVIGYAVQADGFNTSAEAWDAAPTTWTN